MDEDVIARVFPDIAEIRIPAVLTFRSGITLIKISDSMAELRCGSRSVPLHERYLIDAVEFLAEHVAPASAISVDALAPAAALKNVSERQLRIALQILIYHGLIAEPSALEASGAGDRLEHPSGAEASSSLPSENRPALQICGRREIADPMLSLLSSLGAQIDFFPSLEDLLDAHSAETARNCVILRFGDLADWSGLVEEGRELHKRRRSWLPILANGHEWFAGPAIIPQYTPCAECVSLRTADHAFNHECGRVRVQTRVIQL